MNTSLLVKKAVLNAVGVTAYVLALTWFMNHAQQLSGTQQPDWLVGTFMLLLFMVSACVTGALVLLKPILMYLDGAKRDALRLLAYTVVSLVIIAVIVLVTIIVVY